MKVRPTESITTHGVNNRATIIGSLDFLRQFSIICPTHKLVCVCVCVSKMVLSTEYIVARGPHSTPQVCHVKGLLGKEPLWRNR